MSRTCRLLSVILAVVMSLPLLAAAQEEQVIRPAEEIILPDLGGREITIVVDHQYPPYNFINEAGEHVGWDYDTFADICTLINCVPVFVELSWDGTLLAIENGDFDFAAGGITYTPTRDESVDFTMLFQTYSETLLVRADETRFATVAELQAIEDHLVGTQVGTTNAINATTLFGANHVREYDTFGAAIEALANGDVDAVAVDRPAAEGFAEERGDLMTIAENIGSEQGLAFAARPGSDLVEPVNAAMAAMMADGTWNDIYQRWFGD